MPMKFRFSSLVITLTIIVLAFATSLAAQNSNPQPGVARRAITEKDLFNFVWIADPQVSPDGSRAVFTRVVTDEKHTGYETSIWMVATSGNEDPVRMTNGKHDVHPRWSPDGRRIAFMSSTTPEDIEKEQRKKNDAKAGGATTGATTKESAAPGSPPAKADSDGDRESDIHIITRAVYRDNDEGYLDFKRHEHIWVIDVPTTSDESAKPVQLTSGDFDEGEIVWTHDGSRIYFLTSRIDEPYYETASTDIYSVASSPKMPGGTPEKVATVPMGIGDLALSPDGRRIAFHGSVTQPVRSYSQPDLWVMDLAPNAQPRNLTASYDFDMGSSVFGDNAAPRGGNGATLHWSPDGRSLFDMVAKQGRTPLVRVDAQTGAVTEITHGDQAVLDFSITPDARTVVALVSTPVMIGDLFTFSMDESLESLIKDGGRIRITDANTTLWSQLSLTEPEEINYKSFDGIPIQGWIQRPPDFDPKKKYPLILDIHGGPHAAYGWVFDHEF